MAKPINVVFLNRWSRRDMGSSVMRVDQLSGHLARFFGDRYAVSVRYVSNKIKRFQNALLTARSPDTVFIFSKYAAQGRGADDMVSLRQKCRAILVDYVDMPLTGMITAGVDRHIAASYAGAALQTKWAAHAASVGQPIAGCMATVLHGYDAALDGVAHVVRAPDLAIAYMGTPALMAPSPLATQRVTCLDAGMPDTFHRALEKIGRFHAHYCIRPAKNQDDPWVARPFTKGATAAACDAVIFTDRQNGDAVHLLGSNYPFMIDDSDPAKIDAGLNTLIAGFEGPAWRDAQDRVRAMKAHISHKAIATQLDCAIQSCL